MAELSQQEKLQPSLLDRLTDDEPERREESRDRRVLNIPRLRESVVRDLSWLLNTAHLAASVDLSDYPEVERSTLNYGMPDFTGQTASTVDPSAIEKLVRQAIISFEPRILPDTVRVRARANQDQLDHNAVTFDVEGDLWALPLPVRLFLRTDVDLEIGNVSITDVSR
ncbi:MAG: type VI secretion system baseplate subunit TssE [Candidatus Eisenbacteria bacterium]|uniref:Type VI secretion system baseplate subunit TssE n=1 Tax=Eiseniibacteriota bacterium TaxID=2212470 RepID=A0A956LXH8_UNCEI|nr:type VI secretion system baseplate subunit TssE [Candidatus Eisenbacteria bacterium]